MKKVIAIENRTNAGRSAAPPFAGGELADTRGRAMHDLRISVTDRCNFRCVYCMPREAFGADHPFLPYSAILTFEEIARLARIFVELGVNDEHIVQMAERWRDTGHIVRFIEYMDVGSTNGWRMDDVIPSAEVVRRISARWPLEPVDANYQGEVAERWRYVQGGGEIGVIASVTQALCSTCTRIRLSTVG